MSELKRLSSSPHVRDENTTSSIMLDVIIALLPASIMGVYNFGLRALAVIIITVASSIMFEWGYCFITKKQSTILDFSAVVTGLLLALNMPASVPLWIPVIGSAFAIIVVKEVFGGLGQNFMNPALAARCFLLISFATHMNHFTYGIDAMTTATPLAMMKAGGEYSVIQMFIGTIPGTIGETSTIALLLGGIYLLIRRVISIRIPLTYLGSFTICILLFCLLSGRGFDFRFIVGQLCGGGLMLGAWFMATDYVTSPVTPKGKIVFGILLGIITFVFRSPWNTEGAAEGVSYAIIFCNLLVPFIEKVTPPKIFGREGEKA